MPKISVAICTHNPRSDYLSRTLDALERQTLPKTDWDLLVVDNASADPVAGRVSLGWHPLGRHLREDRLGLTEARFRAIAETSGDLIVFVDDDNVLADDYLESALRVSARFRDLGVFGSGAIDPEFEAEPPSEILRFMPLLAVRRVPSARWSNHADDYHSIPCGAGLVVVRSIADRYQGFLERLGIASVVGRRGKLLHSGEDDLFSSLAASQGFGFGLFPELRLTHLIARRLLTQSHVLNLVHDHTFSADVRHYVVDGLAPAKIDAFAYAHLVLHGLRNGVYSMRCRAAAIKGSDEAARFVAERNLHPIQSPRINTSLPEALKPFR